MEFIFGFGDAAVPRSRARWCRESRRRSAGSTSAPVTATSASRRAASCPTRAFDGLDLSESDRRGEAPRLGRHRVSRPVPRARADDRRPLRRGQHEPLPRAHARSARASSTPRTPRSPPSGCLLIEVPDPEFALGTLLAPLLAAVVPAAAPALPVGREPRAPAARARLHAGRRGIAARRTSASTSSSRCGSCSIGSRRRAGCRGAGAACVAGAWRSVRVDDRLAVPSVSRSSSTTSSARCCRAPRCRTPIESSRPREQCHESSVRVGVLSICVWPEQRRRRRHG